MLCPVALREHAGRGRGTRTPNRLIWNQVLCQVELYPYVVRPEGFEPPTPASVARCSNPLSYGRMWWSLLGLNQ